MTNAVHHQILPPPGVDFAVALTLTPSCLPTSPRHIRYAHTSQDDAASPASRARRRIRTVANVVAAGATMLRVFEVRESCEDADSPAKLHLIREHRLHGIVTGLERVQTVATAEDGLDRLVIGFRDAKIALLEWDPATDNLSAVSIHTYERAPQLAFGLPSSFRPQLAVDPSSRCASLLLPFDSLALLPFYQGDPFDMLDEDVGMDAEELEMARTMPYTPSFVLELRGVTEAIKNVKMVAWLEGFLRPTIAVLSEPQGTWTGRLSQKRDTHALHIITLDLTLTTPHALISAIDQLPYDILTIVPCPATPGGLLLMTPSAIFHADQSGKLIGVFVNDWAQATTGRPLMAPFGTPLQQKGIHSASGKDAGARGWDLDLENAKLAFVANSTAMLFLADGDVFRVRLLLDGRSVSGFAIERLEGERIPRVLASTACSVRPVPKVDGHQYVFAGSRVGDSSLARVQAGKVVADPAMATLAAHPAEKDEMDLDFEDLYGDSGEQVSSATLSAAAAGDSAGTLTLQYCDTLPSSGSILDMVPGLPIHEGDSQTPQIVAATGVGLEGGVTVFEQKIVPRKRRKFDVGAASDVWSMSLLAQNNEGRMDSVLLTSDDEGSKLHHIDANGQLVFHGSLPGPTVAAGPMFSSRLFARVTPNGIELMSSDGSHRRPQSDLAESIADGGLRVRSASIADPFVAVLFEDGNICVFKPGHDVDVQEGELEEMDLPEDMEGARFSSIHIFSDPNALLAQLSSSAAKDLNVVESQVRPRHWLCLVRDDGRFEIRDLSNFKQVFINPSLGATPMLLPNVGGADSSSDAKEAVLEVQDMVLTSIGDCDPIPHLVVLCSNGQIVAYEAISAPSDLPSGSDQLKVAFVKVFGYHLERPDPEQYSAPNGEPSEGSHLSFPSQLFTFHDIAGHDGVYVTGEDAAWLMRSRLGALQIFKDWRTRVKSFAPSTLSDLDAQFVSIDAQGCNTSVFPPELHLHQTVPYHKTRLGRTYTAVAVHPKTRLMAAVSVFDAPFVLFDEEGLPVRDPSIEPVLPKNSRSALELLHPVTLETLDGYEFAYNEQVMSLKLVELETKSTPTGRKEFLVVGTTIANGEDRPARGAVYIFDIAETVGMPDEPQEWRYKLKLLCRDAAKGPVTALGDINGYLVSSVGQKIFIRGFEQDEWLVGVAFMDVQIFVTSIRRLKNFLLLADAKKSILFVGFQEDPFKCVVLGKDYVDIATNTADFLINGSSVAFVTTDTDHVIRILEYNPFNPTSQGGHKLLLRTEFQGGGEVVVSMTTSGRTEADDPTTSLKSQVLLGLSNGSIEAVVPLSDDSYRKLQLIQGQLVRNVQHTAGLNPRAFRAVYNPFVSRPLTKGLLDGTLLSSFELLPYPRSTEIVRQVGLTSSILALFRQDFRPQ